MSTANRLVFLFFSFDIFREFFRVDDLQLTKAVTDWSPGLSARARKARIGNIKTLTNLSQAQTLTALDT